MCPPPFCKRPPRHGPRPRRPRRAFRRLRLRRLRRPRGGAAGGAAAAPGDQGQGLLRLGAREHREPQRKPEGTGTLLSRDGGENVDICRFEKVLYIYIYITLYIQECSYLIFNYGYACVYAHIYTYIYIYIFLQNCTELLLVFSLFRGPPQKEEYINGGFPFWFSFKQTHTATGVPPTKRQTYVPLYLYMFI